MISRRETPGIHESLLEALGKIDRPGDAWAAGDRPLTMPGLQVDGLGSVRLPLGEAQAHKLIKLCRQAPYGKGTETVVDTDVRRVWELDPAQFRLTNSKWDAAVDGILEDVKRDLGLEGRKVEAHLYKLLVYEKGSFFLPHRDGEKLDRMVATLVISLPSVHKGGELIVSHDGRQREIAFKGAASGHELSYAAFYADCRHEVRPLRSGYRLSLVYNVTLARSRGEKAKKGLAAPTRLATTAAISGLLHEWSERPESRKLAVTLEHRYTQDGLELDTLKGVDRARAEALLEAAEQADCVAHLALVTLWQCGDAEGSYDDSYSYRGNRWDGWGDEDDDDEDDEGDEPASDYAMGDIHEYTLSANHWSDRRGKKVRLGEVFLEDDEIVSETPVEEQNPAREEFEGYTGNAGMTLERWYHRAAIVIWPRKKHFDALCTAGTESAIGGFEQLVERLGRAAKATREGLRQECRTFAAAIIDSWKPSRRYSAEGDGVDRGVFLPLLLQLDDPDLVRRFLSQVMRDDGEVAIDEPFSKFCQRHGWASFEAELSEVLANATTETIVRNAQLLRRLCLERSKDPDRIELCIRLCARGVEALREFDLVARSDWRAGEIDRAALLASMAGAMLAVGAEAQLSQLVEHALGCAEKYDLTEAHLGAVFALKSQFAKLPRPGRAVEHWFAECRAELEKRTTRPPRKPTDYRRPSQLSCTCGDCRKLAAFLDDPELKQQRFPLAKERRRHLHQIISQHRLDTTHVTERKGRPYSLVCTKTTASYEETRRVHKRDLRNLSRLVELEKSIRRQN